MSVPQPAAQRWGSDSHHRRFLPPRLGKQAPQTPSRAPLPAQRVRPLGHRAPVLCASVGDILSSPSFLEGTAAQAKAAGYGPASCRPPWPAPCHDPGRRGCEVGRGRGAEARPPLHPGVPGPGSRAAEEPLRFPAGPLRLMKGGLTLPSPRRPLRPLVGVRPPRCPQPPSSPRPDARPVRAAVSSSCGPTGGGRGPGPDRSDGRGEEARHRGAALRAATPTCLLVVIAHHDEIVGQPGHG